MWWSYCPLPGCKAVTGCLPRVVWLSLNEVGGGDESSNTVLRMESLQENNLRSIVLLDVGGCIISI